MTALSKAMAVVSLISNIAYGANTYTLQDINGSDVDVPLSELNSAYFAANYQEGLNYKIPNGDGSVAIVNPVFEHAGKKIPFFTGTSNEGVCRYLGFESAHGIEAKSIEGRVIVAVMARDGRLNTIYEHERGSNIVRVIVCSHQE